MQQKTEEIRFQTIEQLVREHITKVYRHTKYNAVKTAQIVGLSRANIYLKLHEYGLMEEKYR